MKTATARILFTVVAIFWVFASVSTEDASGGLALNFYDTSCPGVYNEVDKVVGTYISKTPTLDAPLLIMHFHDCFVRVSIFWFSLPAAIYTTK